MSLLPWPRQSAAAILKDSLDLPGPPMQHAAQSPKSVASASNVFVWGLTGALLNLETPGVLGRLPDFYLETLPGIRVVMTGGYGKRRR